MRLPVPVSARRGLRRVAWPVWNRTQNRLRAPIRALLPLVVTLVALAAIQTTVRTRFDHPVVELLELGGFVVVLAVGTLGSARFLDRRSLAGYGLGVDREWARQAAVGAAVATASNAFAFAAVLLAGWASVAGFAETPGILPFLPALAITFCLVTVAATWEEVVFRGIILTNLVEGTDGYLPRWVAVGLSLTLTVVVFAFLHGGKVTAVSQYGYYLLAGVLLGGLYVLTGDLALSIGFHVAYNFTMSVVFGLGVSQQTPELLVLTVTGPTRWVGEEGLIHVVAVVLAGIALLAYVRWRDGRLAVAETIGTWCGRC
ncbi:CPBP family intramembrane glutamic endopeptidase [Haloarcula marina]|uniref:CPBP family intramembrane glutamic endopeptidase n=1 Tax=Haloarcula marina TaxID=2961574 RepID=UPI0020B67732|nr:CPBP family intramembrane glutamic endopeptidase [Halomicroarcula marina]